MRCDILIRKPFRCQTINSLLERARGNYLLLSALNILARSAEMARLYGCDLWSVLSRGSQFKVRIALLSSD